MSDDHEPATDGQGTDEPKKAREPLGGLTEEIERRRKRRSDDDIDDPFEDMSVGSVEADAVWEQLHREDVEPTADPSVAPGDTLNGGASDTEVDPGGTVGDLQDRPDLDGRDVRVVEKRSFCQGCQYFSDPPSVDCSHEGTEILELVDVEHFRVVDCPMVAEAESIGDELGSDRSVGE